ncbi:hypothetical protein M6D93_00580 [Jatrophihabitans telluris]|uniref:MmcQ/YjbR family DNA-binding protein n=1 Tax=Jatrophihabitans telluris TaxID=2038343 RepID=A0ABY4R062_9ACTN|nr:hypothetical protein [Jatrophihabitans telluris]UQX88516.1 hypothetical protein M6D93_00580 [Jatrophihabitans telluris]
MTNIDVVRAIVAGLPRSYEVIVRDRVKFRVGRLVYLAFSRDETTMGFAFPKVERAALVESRPDVFQLPPTSDLRYNWVLTRLAALEHAEARELVLDAWAMVVPKGVASAELARRAALCPSEDGLHGTAIRPAEDVLHGTRKPRRLIPGGA